MDHLRRQILSMDKKSGSGADGQRLFKHNLKIDQQGSDPPPHEEGGGGGVINWKMHCASFPVMWVFKLISPREALWRIIVQGWLREGNFRCTLTSSKTSLKPGNRNCSYASQNQRIESVAAFSVDHTGWSLSQELMVPLYFQNGVAAKTAPRPSARPLMVTMPSRWQHTFDSLALAT